MNRKLRLLIPVLAVLLFAAALLIFCSVAGINFTTGICLVADNGIYFLIDGEDPVVIGSGDQFSDLTVGDQILVVHGPIMETYPARTDVYFCLKLSDGSELDIPVGIHNTMVDMGWLNQDPEGVPDDFSIRFVWGNTAKNFFDTEVGLIQKDLVTAGVATAEFVPTVEMLQQIYDQVCALDITAIKREMSASVLKPRSSDTSVDKTSLTTYIISITINGEKFRIVGDETASFFQEEGEAVRFMEFVEFMIQLVYDMPEYQALPDAEDGHDYMVYDTPEDLLSDAEGGDE